MARLSTATLQPQQLIRLCKREDQPHYPAQYRLIQGTRHNGLLPAGRAVRYSDTVLRINQTQPSPRTAFTNILRYEISKYLSKIDSTMEQRMNHATDHIRSIIVIIIRKGWFWIMTTFDDKFLWNPPLETFERTPDEAGSRNTKLNSARTSHKRVLGGMRNRNKELTE